MPIRYIDELRDLKGKKIFIRVDFNVPQDDKGNITEDTRIAGAIPTIKYALEQGARVILASHLGRPKGEKKPKYSICLLYTSPSPRDRTRSRMPSSA